MTHDVWYYLATGLLAFVLGPLFGILLGKAGVVYGTAGVALFLAGRMGSREGSVPRSACAGMLTMVAPALAAGLPARWIAEALVYNRYISAAEQVKVSAYVFVLFLLLGAVAGMMGREFGTIQQRSQQT